MAQAKQPIPWEDFEQVAPDTSGDRIAWGGGPLAFGDLRLPDGPGPHPVAVVVHGGCWQSLAELGYVSHLAGALAEEGWATWSLEFRRLDDEGGAWPGMLQDVGNGLDHLRTLAEEWPLDLDRVVTVGHSSGGHLALWLAARADLPSTGTAAPLRGSDPLPVHGVIGLAPICDLVDLHGRTDQGCPESSVSDLLEGEPAEQPERLALVDPSSRLPLGVPQLLLTGTLDETVPLAHVRTYGAKALAAGDPVTTKEVPDAGHFEVVAPWDPTWPVTLAALRAFLGQVAR